MLSSTQVLIVANEPELLSHVYASPTLEEHEVTMVGRGDDAIELVRAGLNPKLVFIDVGIASTCDGLQTMQRLKLTQPHSKFVAICASGNTRQAVEAMRLGAQECLVKPFAKNEFEAIVARCLGRSPESTAKNIAEVEDVGGGHFLVTSCPAMAKIRSYCGFVGKVDLPVLILGESGTGKEIVARLIHKISPRASRPFLKLNCAAMPADLLESELFGYEPGAFTGATHAKPGKFEQANHGTILLDEIGEMPPNLQAKLLHVLQDQQFSRLGGRTAIKVDVRILAATNIDVEEALASRKLREDLYYRLNAFVVRMPPLRERKDEIGLLLEHFVAQQAKQWNVEPIVVSPALREACKRYSWPGNVRELENFTKRLLVLRDEQSAIAELTASTSMHSLPVAPLKSMIFTPAGVQSATNQSVANLKSVGRSAMGEAEAIAISQALAHTQWNRKRAAGLLNISYRALLYKIKQYNLERLLQSRTVAAD
jgi:two-component system, NtrC family, response regulator AtoC